MKLNSILLTFLLMLSGMMCNLSADEAKGTPFFLLSDASYSTSETAMVRLEVQDIGTVYEYGGADVYLYRIDDPIKFLKAQKNLHRIDVDPRYGGDTFANILSMVWDKLDKNIRLFWRSLFTSEARSVMTDSVPQTKAHPLSLQSTPKIYSPQYKPLKQHTLVDSFRYPVHKAKPIQPPKNLSLAGSSSEFIGVSEGNVMIPVGKLPSGLYLVEAMVGDFRATTLLFISDSVAVTKVSSAQMAVWVANRHNGEPVENSRIIWSDGLGELAHGDTDRNGLAIFERKGPEKSYVFGEDEKGGVFISENFYYDSEIYNTKLYALTDRPLYRPGETVYVKFIGRRFLSARESVALGKGVIKLVVLDPNALPVASKTIPIDAKGANTSFNLPNNAASGGYSLRFEYGDNLYGAGFRVSEYQKPHFEINIFPDHPEFKTSEVLSGKIVLRYPDGKPVKNGVLDLTLRSQALTMSEGELGYGGEFPLKITNETITTDEKGVALFRLPPASQPSRYVLSVLATDGAAYRVRATREMLIERGADHYILSAPATYSDPDETVRFTYIPQSIVSNGSKPVLWRVNRFEDRRIGSGTIKSEGTFSVRFNGPGTYTVTLLDEHENVLGATTHYVSGGSIKAPQGSIKMVFDQTLYRPGDTAKALITFPEKVDQALFTLERDRVEKTALMSKGATWIRPHRLSDTQWEVSIPVLEEYGPNITLSAVYVRNGEYVFQNLGLKVEQNRLKITVQPDKESYAPGDKVTLTLKATLNGKASSGTPLVLGVVDEMVYVLQREIAPDIFDFFYHPRRNNVRTSASLQFIGYDLAKAPSSSAFPNRTQTPQRAIKLQERPRRDDKDTAYWAPQIITDARGVARISFTMPDSLTRWRVTVRGMDKNGIVGQNLSYIRSDKPFYIKWTSPNWMRTGDEPVASVALFNQSSATAKAEFSADGGGNNFKTETNLKPGINFITFPLSSSTTTSSLNLRLNVGGKTIDALRQPIRFIPSYWTGKHTLFVPLNAKDTPITLPKGARSLRLQFVNEQSEHFRRIMDDLIEYPYGCVEQTSSRIIPYSLALQSLRPDEKELHEKLSQRLYTFRFRLAQMAGPDATFGWWSVPSKEGDAFLTSYAYFADYYASGALGIKLPEGHFDTLLDIYRNNGLKRSLFHRALMLDWMAQMGLPVRSLSEELSKEIVQRHPAANLPDDKESVIMSSTSQASYYPMAMLLNLHTLKKTGGKADPAMSPLLESAVAQLRATPSPMGRALLLLNGYLPQTQADSILDEIRDESATIDRTVTLLWIYKGVQSAKDPNPISKHSRQVIFPETGWKAYSTFASQNAYYWSQSEPMNTLRLNANPKTPLKAIVKYEAAESTQSTLPLRIERRFYRLDKKEVETDVNGSVISEEGGKASYELVPLSPNEPFYTNRLYLDEIVLTKQKASPIRFAILEAPLAPGMTPDTGTWGINVSYPGKDDYQSIEKARFDLSTQGYTVPVDYLQKSMVIRHLIRPSQTGTFKLPPVRLFKMYQTEQKAFEDSHRATITVR